MKILIQLGKWALSLLMVFVLTVLINMFLLQMYKVDGHSMDPTLHDQERMVISKLSHTFKAMPDYGDIVVIDSRVDRPRSMKDDFLENPLVYLITGKNEAFMYVKRVIGKPGDTLELKNNKVYRNGEELQEPYIKEVMNIPMENTTYTVPENHVFVMGDNRNNSKDSRHIGAIPLDHVLGKKLFGL
ncbi:signal peptidase I [Priestia taiwanensis]|uniref:Signal peptidase I n=1 Tax=Priestia taiwanensis TaxID=1347902 RepID=A0A917EQY7_9BACI|nr:signal peptidase I [Priestia taiwanensis]GGE75006.1 signal peptidase I [Priestia taiwanensis]